VCTETVNFGVSQKRANSGPFEQVLGFHLIPYDLELIITMILGLLTDAFQPQRLCSNRYENDL
jgi:hypothetical protein